MRPRLMSFRFLTTKYGVNSLLAAEATQNWFEWSLKLSSHLPQINWKTDTFILSGARGQRISAEASASVTPIYVDLTRLMKVKVADNKPNYLRI
jgi:hypothetical protein